MTKKSKILLLSLCFYTSLPLVLWVQKKTVSNAYLLVFFIWAVLGAWMFFKCWQYLLFKPSKTPSKLESALKDLEDYQQQYRALSQRYNELVNAFGQKCDQQKEFDQKLQRLKDMQKNQQEEYVFLNQDLQAQLEKRERSLSDSRLLVQEQRQVIEKKQSEINLLSLKVNDLEYEIENLLRLENQSSSEIFSEPYGLNASSQLIVESPMTLKDKLGYYTQMAKTLTETNPFAQKKSGVISPFGSLLIDQRRLFDKLESEDVDVILIYSLEERRIVFVNRCIKQLVGWNPDQFNRDFTFLVQKGLDQWQESLNHLQDEVTQEARLLVKTQSGQNILVQCYLKKLSEGVFQNHAMGVLSSVAKR